METNYTQLKSPNLSVVGQDGLCLAYVTEVFGVPNKYSSATVAWEDAQYKHAGEQPPMGVSVPVWFSYNGPDGHVAGATPSGVYSTTAQGDKTFSSVSALVSWMGEGFKYLGWSEDINNVRVVQPQEDTGMNSNGVTVVIQAAFRRDPTPEELAFWNGRDFAVCLDNLATTSEYQEITGWMEAGKDAGTSPTVLTPGTYKVS